MFPSGPSSSERVGYVEGVSENDARLFGGIANLIGAQVSSSHHAKQAVKLINGEHCRCWIVDSVRQSPERNINNNTERERRILRHGTFRPEFHGIAQRAIVDCWSAAVKIE